MSTSPLSRCRKYLFNQKLLPEFLNKYALSEETIGIGGNSIVLRGRLKSSDTDVAIKFIFKDKSESSPCPSPPAANSNSTNKLGIPTPTTPSVFVQDAVLGSIPIEIHILRSLSHPNMIKFLDYYADRYFFYLVTELHGPAVPWSEQEKSAVNGMESSVGFATTDGGHRNASSQFQFHAGEWDDADDKLPPPVPALKTSRDLYECLERHGPFSEERARKVFRQIIDCVLYLHSHDICHRDLKDENITIDEQLSIKLIDFGSAAFTHQPLSGFHGTEAYCPPEAINSHNSSSSSTYDGKKADVWTLGILLHIMLTRNTPFNSFWEVLNRRWDLNLNIRTSSSSPNIQIPTGVRDLLNLMLQKDPNKRCDLETVWNHPWVGGGERSPSTKSDAKDANACMHLKPIVTVETEGTSVPESEVFSPPSPPT